MNILYEGLGSIFQFIYLNVTPNYGLTIIIFTLIVKLLLLPFAIKQQKSMVDMQRIQPHLEEIRSKYKNDMQKMNEETMKIYAEHKVNPAGGCLPMLVQFPIFIALYGVITQPLKYIFKFSENQLYGINYTLNSLIKPDVIKSQINMIEKSKEVVSGVININDLIRVTAEQADNIVSLVTQKIHLIPDFNLLLGSLKRYGYDEGNITEISKLIQKASTLSMNFLGINLAQFPKENLWSTLILIPLFAGLTTYLSSIITMKISKSNSNSKENEFANSMQGSMTAMMPMMTMFMTYTLPAGLGIYMIFSNIIQMIQQYFLNKYIPREVKKDDTNRENRKDS
jgi:YidC/Oxa1 family membrane protein insertase